jgi:hypothetical protein
MPPSSGSMTDVGTCRPRAVSCFAFPGSDAVVVERAGEPWVDNFRRFSTIVAQDENDRGALLLTSVRGSTLMRHNTEREG